MPAKAAMSGMFPELEPPTPKPVPTTAPLFDAEPAAVATRRASGTTAPIPAYRPFGDVALFDTALALPSDTNAGAQAFQFAVD